MIRYTQVGRGAVQVLEAVAHDQTGAAQVAEALERLAPPRVHLDLGSRAWDAIVQGTVRVEPVWDQVALGMAGIDGVRPYALYHAVRLWAQRAGGHVHLMLATLPPPGRLDVWRLRRIMRAEGLDAPAAQHAMIEFETQVLPRIPALEAWWQRRQTMLVDQCRALFASGTPGVVVAAHPQADRMASQAQR